MNGIDKAASDWKVHSRTLGSGCSTLTADLFGIETLRVMSLSSSSITPIAFAVWEIGYFKTVTMQYFSSALAWAGEAMPTQQWTEGVIHEHNLVEFGGDRRSAVIYNTHFLWLAFSLLGKGWAAFVNMLVWMKKILGSNALKTIVLNLKDSQFPLVH